MLNLRSIMLLSAALLCVALFSACSDGPSMRVEKILLLSLADSAGGAEVEGGKIERRWIDLQDRRAPVFWTTRNQRISFAIEAAPERTLTSAFGFAAGGGEATRATFRVFCGETVLAEETRTAETVVKVESLRATLPVDCSKLSLEIEFLERGGRRAVWVDPVVDLLVPASAKSEATEANSEPPNLLLITADTTRFDVLGPYGGEAATPTLDRLAAEGLVFTQAYSAALATTPSHTSIFTSLPSAEHGVYDNTRRLADHHLTLAEVLRGVGYQTAAFVSARPVARDVGLVQGFDVYDDVFAFDAVSGLEEFSNFERRADLTIDRFLSWFNDRNETRPFFVWLHFFDPHQPYAPPGLDEKPAPQRVHEDHSTEQALAISQEARARYYAEVEHLDEQLSRVIDAVDVDSTWVVLTADHGENFLDRGPLLAFDHSGLFPEVSQVPLILRAPDAADIRGRRGGLISSIDLAPTLVDALRLPVPDEWRGRSFRRLFREDGEHRPRVVVEGAARFEIAVRTPEWTYREIGEEYRTPEIQRLLGYEPEVWRRLYDRRADPEERRNLIQEGVEPTEELTALVAAARAGRTAEAAAIDSESHREALRALGYLD